LKQYGAVSAETAQEMAQGIRMATGSIYGISTTGIAGPGGGSAEKPVGLVYIAIAGPDSCHAETLPLDPNIPLSRAEIQQQAAVHALSLLWKTIRESNLYKKEV
ncbi:MAG: CinA family protein, partial [Peptococcaceae bacterium]|nr:CinA family protein [Peptococcaceae bacterium]